MDAVLDHVMEAVNDEVSLDGPRLEEVRDVLDHFADLGPSEITHSTAICVKRLKTPGPPVEVLIRLTNPLHMEDDQGHPVRFMWVLLSDQKIHPHMDIAAEFAHLLADEDILATFLAANTTEELEAAYTAARDDEVAMRAHIPEALRPSGRFFGLFIDDVRRRLPHYISDWTDGLNTKSLASTVFLFFACLAPSVAFGGLLALMTDGNIGVVETLVATSITGILYAIFSGQPLSILGSTGPITVFIGILYGLSQALGVDYLPALAWVGLWTSFFLFILVAIDGAAWIRFFTRFTDDTFAALISLIFVYEALNDVIGAFRDGVTPPASALFGMVLAVGTFVVASQLSAIRRSAFLRRGLREFLADFGPTIAILTLSAAALLLPSVAVESLAAPDTFGTTSGRAWFVNPFDAPKWVWGAAAIPAMLGAILVYLDQNITVRLVNSPGNQLKKGSGYHLDMSIVALLIAGFSLVGLPWTVAATVRSLNHVRSLATTDERDNITSVIETRTTGFSIHVLMGASLLLLPTLKLIPMPVLFGLFLFMGIASMRGNQFFERVRLFLIDPEQYPTTHYLRAIPPRVIATFTIIQATGLAVLWAVKASPFAVLFPLFIALLVPIRLAMTKLYKPEHLALLDAEELPNEEAFRETD